MIWDTAGQERFHALGPIYYRSHQEHTANSLIKPQIPSRDANGALLVYDITDRESLVKVQSWVHELRQEQGTKIQLVIAGNGVRHNPY